MSPSFLLHFRGGPVLGPASRHFSRGGGPIRGSSSGKICRSTRGACMALRYDLHVHDNTSRPYVCSFNHAMTNRSLPILPSPDADFETFVSVRQRQPLPALTSMSASTKAPTSIAAVSHTLQEHKPSVVRRYELAAHLLANSKISLILSSRSHILCKMTD